MGDVSVSLSAVAQNRQKGVTMIWSICKYYLAVIYNFSRTNSIHDF